jgi:hypothetical protein
MKTFSVLTVSKRSGWLDIAIGSIGNQTHTPHDWVIVTELQQDVRIPSSGLVSLFGEIKMIDAPLKQRVSNLNASLNEGLRHVDTDYVIFYQDFIELPPDCFEKLLVLADEKTFVTTCTPNYDGSDDGRYTGVDKPRPCKPAEWEANVAIAPMAVIRELGGFDEEYDNGWSWDNVNLAERAAVLGCNFIIDESNRPKLYPHDKVRGLKLNGDFHAENMEKIKNGTKPLRLHHL